MSDQKPRGLDRRLFLAGSAAAAAMAPVAAHAALGDLMYYIGTYSAGGGQGLQLLSYTPAYDKWTLGKADATIQNASFGVYSSTHQRHYIVNEQQNGTVGVYQANSRGKLTKRGEVSSQGSSPCYVSLNGAETHLAVANYGSGNIAVYKLDPKSGLPLEPAVVKQNSGTGANPERQEGPHAHWVKFSPNGKFIYAVDLGTDEVLGYPFDAATGAVGEKFVAFKCDPGFGPRHLVLHPAGQVGHLLGELASAVVTLRPQEDGTFIGTQYTSTLPEGFTGTNTAGHIIYNLRGNFLYVSNRGHNSIARFALDDTGRLILLDITPVGGDGPRHFVVLHGLDRVLVANQNSNELTILAQNVDGTFKKTPPEKISITKPVFIGRFD